MQICNKGLWETRDLATVVNDNQTTVCDADYQPKKKQENLFI